MGVHAHLHTPVRVREASPGKHRASSEGHEVCQREPQKVFSRETHV